jgi:hypothetical protein
LLINPWEWGHKVDGENLGGMDRGRLNPVFFGGREEDAIARLEIG